MLGLTAAFQWSRSHVWRACLGVFAAALLLVWLWLPWDPFFLPVLLLAAANAFVAREGFERYGNLVVALAVLCTAFDLIFAAAIGFLIALMHELAKHPFDLAGVH
jgi:hypothetical protein